MSPSRPRRLLHCRASRCDCQSASHSCFRTPPPRNGPAQDNAPDFDDNTITLRLRRAIGEVNCDLRDFTLCGEWSGWLLS